MARAALSAAYKALHPDCLVAGLEHVPAAAERARQQLDVVHCADVEKHSLGEVGFERHHIELLIYGDVLDHLVDPWSVLRAHAEWLAPGGQVRACIPNIAHWSIVTGLLQGKRAYQDAGLLDRTHLRFFTLKSIQEMFTQAGLYITQIRQRVFAREQTDDARARLQPALNALGVVLDAQAYANLAALQYILSAEKRTPL